MGNTGSMSTFTYVTYMIISGFLVLAPPIGYVIAKSAGDKPPKRQMPMGGMGMGGMAKPGMGMGGAMNGMNGMNRMNSGMGGMNRMNSGMGGMNRMR